MDKIFIALLDKHIDKLNKYGFFFFFSFFNM
jgi:hypothetical protein